MADDLDKDLCEFTGLLSEPHAFLRHRFTLAELRANQNWSWAGLPGVYCFVVDGTIVYVGRALAPNTVGRRIDDAMKRPPNECLRNVVGNGEVLVEVITLPVELDFLASALEAFLTGRRYPRCNEKRQ